MLSWPHFSWATLYVNGPMWNSTVFGVSITSPHWGCEVLQLVCLFVRLSVCMSTRETRKNVWPNFTNFCACCLCPWLGPALMALRYVIPVLLMTSCFHTMGPIGGRTALRCVLARRLSLAERRLLWVGRPASSQAVLLPRWPRTRDVARATALQSTRRLRMQPAVVTVEAATTLWPCGCMCRSSPYRRQDSLVSF